MTFWEWDAVRNVWEINLEVEDNCSETDLQRNALALVFDWDFLYRTGPKMACLPFVFYIRDVYFP